MPFDRGLGATIARGKVQEKSFKYFNFSCTCNTLAVMNLERVIRPMLVASSLFLSMIAAHAIGGGSFEFSLFLPIILIGTYLFFYFRKVNEFSGPQLAALVLVFQFLGHMTINGHGMHSNLGMSISHLVAGVIGFHVVRRCERCIEIVEQKFVSVFIPQIFRRINISILRDCHFASESHSAIVSIFKATIRDRAPPSLATFSIEPTTA